MAAASAPLEVRSGGPVFEPRGAGRGRCGQRARRRSQTARPPSQQARATRQPDHPASKRASER
eukprot:10826637-Alexandrium_andersonii.AAC.1